MIALFHLLLKIAPPCARLWDGPAVLLSVGSGGRATYPQLRHHARGQDPDFHCIGYHFYVESRDTQLR
jgi:hypothetical protein